MTWLVVWLCENCGAEFADFVHDEPDFCPLCGSRQFKGKVKA